MTREDTDKLAEDLRLIELKEGWWAMADRLWQVIQGLQERSELERTEKEAKCPKKPKNESSV